jgi:hypothetical protein
MRTCQWYVVGNTECREPASKLMSRPPTEEEQEWDRKDNGVSFIAVVECAVCSSHLEVARQHYPFESDI